MTEIYKQPTSLFAQAMEREMVASHDIKGHGLPKLNLEKLNFELDHHVEKLKKACSALESDMAAGTLPSQWLNNRILEFAADVGNCAMFYTHSYGLLNEARLESRRQEPDLMENVYESEKQ